VAFDREAEGIMARLVEFYSSTKTVTGKRGGRREVRTREQFSCPLKGDPVFRSPFVGRYLVVDAETAEEAICRAKQTSVSS
jgi:exosome complex RNA-binding protein Rrp42 (RNase PH superfamily)